MKTRSESGESNVMTCARIAKRGRIAGAAAVVVAACLSNSANADTISFSGRNWTTNDPDGSNPPSYAVIDANSGSMTGNYGGGSVNDATMVTPVTIAVGSMISYDYKLTNQGSNWVGDSYGDFRGGGIADDTNNVGYLISGRVGYQSDFQAERALRFQDAGFNLSGPTYNVTEDNPGIRVRWTFPTSNSYQITVTNIGDSTPIAHFSGSTGGNPVTDITFFRQAIFDSLQTVTLSNFYQYGTTPAASGNTYTWNAASGTYTTGGNWSSASAPTLADGGAINNGGTATVNTSGAGAATAYDLHVSGNSILEVVNGGELLVGNTLGIGNATTGNGTLNQSGGLIRLMDQAQDDLRIALGVGSSGTYNLSGGELMVGDSFTIGRDGNGTFNMTGGMISQAGFITVGGNATATGTFNMSGGVVNQTFGDLEIGNLATGTANFSGGTFTAAPGRAIGIGNRIGGTGAATISGTALVKTEDLFIAGNDNTVTNLGGNGSLNINGGELQVGDDFIVGNYGNGTLSMTGGLVSKSGWIVLGNNPASSGTMTMSGGTINQTFGDIEIGDEATGNATFSGGFFNGSWGFFVGNRNGGTGTATITGSATISVNNVVVGRGENPGDVANGTLNISGGTLDIDDDFIIGRYGTGTVTMSDGNISNAGWIVLGDEATGNGTLNVSGGTISQNVSGADLEIGDAGSGTYNQSGGTVNINNGVYIAKQGGSTGSASISGGTLNSLFIVNNSTSSLSVSGTGVVNAGPLDGPGATSVNGSGVLNVSHVRQSSLTITGNGAVNVAANGSAAGISVLDNLSIDSTGTLDLKDNDLVVNNGSFTTIYGQVLAGAFSNSPVPGAISSTATTGNEILALFDNSLVGASDWNGVPIGGNAVVGKYTYMGDMNIDGQVTGDDYTVIDANLNTTPAVGLAWLNGDANLDGTVTGDDYTVIDANLGLGVGNPLSPSALTAVPEPTSLVLGAAGVSAVCSRRRRRVPL